MRFKCNNNNARKQCAQHTVSLNATATATATWQVLSSNCREFEDSRVSRDSSGACISRVHLIFHFGLLCAAFITSAPLTPRQSSLAIPLPPFPSGYTYTGRRSQNTSSVCCNFTFYCQVVSNAMLRERERERGCCWPKCLRSCALRANEPTNELCDLPSISGSHKL